MQHPRFKRGLPVRAALSAAIALPALFIGQQQAHAFSYDPAIPGVGADVVAVSDNYFLTDTSDPPTGAVPVNAGMSAATITSTINASDGRTIVFAAGTYNIGNITVTKDVTLRSAKGAKVWFDGARNVTGWTDTSPGNGTTNGPVWSTSSVGYEFPPTAETANIDVSLNPRSDDGEMVFRGGVPQVQRSALADINALGEFFVDRGADKIYISATSAPTGVAITNLDFAFEFPHPQAEGATISGLNFRRYAGAGPTGTVAEPSGNPGAAVRMEAGSGTIERCSFFWNGHFGLQTRGGNVTVTRSNFVSNGNCGVRSGAQNVSVSGNYISWNNAEGFQTNWGAAGIKVSDFNNSRIYDNFLEGNKGPAIWVDVYCTGAQTFRNYIKGGTTYDDDGEGNGGTPNGIFVEISKDNVVAFNLITGTGAAIHAGASDNTRIYNNTLYDNKNHLYIHDEPGRSDPDLPADNPNTALIENDLPVTAEARNNILLAPEGNAIDAYAVSLFNRNTNPARGRITNTRPSVSSKKRFTALDFNVYPSGTVSNMIKWQNTDGQAATSDTTPPTQPAATFYNSLDGFRNASATFTGTFEESGGITRDANTLFEGVGSRDFRISGADTGAATGGFALPAFVRNLMRDITDFVPDALTHPRCDLADIANGAFGAAPTTAAQKYRGAFKPTNVAPVAALTSPANGSRVIGAPSNLNLTATASDADGNVTRVEFYNGATLLGTDNDGSNGWSFTLGSAARGTYSLTARAFDNELASGNSAVVTHTIFERTRAVNAGGPAVAPFAADSGFSTSVTYAAPTPPTVSTSGVADPAPEAIYQSERYGNGDFTYTATGLAASSPYTVRLHFAETFSGVTGSGQRLFNISVTGAAAVNNYDIYAQAGGAGKAVVREFAAISTSAGAIVVTFGKLSTSNSPKINGIEILR